MKADSMKLQRSIMKNEYDIISHWVKNHTTTHDCPLYSPIGENDVGVHGSDVEMVDHGVLHSVGIVSQRLELIAHLSHDLLEVGHLRHRNLLLHLDRVLQRLLHVVN